MTALELTSPAFDDGEQIPRKDGYRAENVNPPLAIDGVPDEAVSLALVMDDPDAVEPAGKVWDHWVVWNVPPDRREIPEDWTPGDAMEGTNDYGEVGYGGPNPPDREHRYRFKLFALDSSLSLPADTDTDADALGEAMAGHIVGQTQLEGTYPA
ncbi:YbhB/YbcL family Raf kinase inhibitor-like protein [Haloarchaeobius iranensis]